MTQSMCLNWNLQTLIRLDIWTTSFGKGPGLGKTTAATVVMLAFLSFSILASVAGLVPLTVEAASTLPGVEWSKNYGGSEYDVALQAQQTSDGGYALIGVTYSYGDASQGDGWLVKTLANGTIQWSKSYGVAASSDSFQAGEQTSDGGYILAGITTSSRPAHDFDAWLVKTDAVGNSVWSRSIGGSAHDYAYSVEQASDGGYIVARRTYDDVKGDFIAWLDKTDPSGNVVWSRQYATASNWQGDAWIKSVQQTGDGGYVFAGWTSINSAGQSDFWLVKTNSSGYVLWDRKYGGSNMDEAASVQLTSDGGYVIAGYTQSYGAGQGDAWLIKVNSAGQLDWSQTYGGAKSDSAMSVQQTLDGGYVFSGDSASFGVGAWLVKTTSNGTMEWNKNYGDPYGFLRGYSVQQTIDGGYIVGGDCSSAIAGSVNGFLLKLMGEDSDGDGLLDTWEKYGIDYNNDGIVELDLPALGADWQHKDLFVEVDYMQGHYPNTEALNDVKQAFAKANVTNPDGNKGIRLHVDVDEAISHQDAIKGISDLPNDFDIIKSSYFGTAAQRSSPNKVNITAAKKLAYRYCLFIHDYSDWNGTHWEVTHSSGIAELPGNDFIVSLGSFTGGKGNRDEQAGTFMHELGHTLNLGHGGSDDINYKPNYLSIMSYSFQFSDLVPWRPLDYSREKLPTLNEGSLDETVGIQHYGIWLYTMWNDSKQVYKKGIATGPLDWDGNGSISASPIQANINNFPSWGCASPPMEPLTGHDDWSNLKYNFRETPGYADGAHPQVQDQELTWDMVTAIRESALAIHDLAVFNVTSPSLVWTQGNTLSVNVTLVNFGGSDETANVTVYANTTLIASANLIIQAGNLSSFNLPYNGGALTPGNYTLKAIVSQVANETYTADNTITGSVITVTGTIPELNPTTFLATLFIASSVLTLAFRKKKK